MWKNTTFQNESRGEGESSGEILPEIKENLRIYLDCPGAKVQMSVKKRGGRGREGKLHFRRFLKTC